MTKNIVINNMFTENEISVFNKILNDKDIKLDEPQLGRTRFDFNIIELGNEIISKLNKIAKSFNEKLFLSNVYYCEYNNKYGNPELSIHTDNTSDVFCLDYQLDGNIVWDIYVEGESFQLKNNEALTLNTNSQAHWRPKKVFKDGEYLKMIFFHFADVSQKNIKILTKEEMIPMQQKWNHLWEQ